MTVQDGASFDALWQSQQEETDYVHWTRGEPANQIQLAFRSHWRLFQELMGPAFAGRRVVELGCGRGTVSAYFADAGFDCTLLDISPTVIDTATRLFEKHGLRASYAVADAYETGLPPASFDVAVSIGLLEHLEDLERALAEQVRLLDTGGLLLAYVVPENPGNVQKDYGYICDILALYDRALGGERPRPAKPDVYRSDDGSRRYFELLSKMPMRDVQASGVYPLPMISPSPSFPFTLMPPPMERVLVNQFTRMLDQRRDTTGRNPWLCDESFGQAFLVWGWKTS